MKLYIQLLLFFILMSFYGHSQVLINGTYSEKLNDLTIFYTIKGKGPALLVGHPTAGKIAYARSLQPLENYFTLVYYDARGTGNSQAPATLQAYGQFCLEEEIEALRKHLQLEQIWLFGHSDQSSLALTYALRYPKNTAGLLLSGTSWIGDQQESVERRRLHEKQRKQESAWFAQVIADWDYMDLHQTTVGPKGEDLSFTPTKWWCYNEETAQKVIPIVREIAKAGKRKPIDGNAYIESPQERSRYLENQNRFDQIKVPVLLINGKYDPNNSPRYLAQLQQKVPNSHMVLIDHAGHYPWIEQSEVTFKAIIEWLEKINYHH